MTKHPFSLIEILLALAIVSIGICSVMVLFPVGATANQNAIMETHAAAASEQLLHYLKFKTEKDGALPSGIPDSFSITTGSLDFTIDQLTNKTSTWGNNSDFPSLHPHNSDSNVYQLVSSHADAASKELTDADQRAIAYVWKSPVVAHYTTLSVLVSWPAERPYTQRQKAIYTMGLYVP